MGKGFCELLVCYPGVNGVPLSYIVRDAAEPEDGAEYETFDEKMIARAPHTGQYFLADSHRVHNLITGFLQGEQSESWIRNIARYQDGRRDIIALRRHYAGEGNSTRRISDAKRIQSTLHYKSERALPFNKFLDSLQRMFTIFEEENEPLAERAKVDELLTKVQHTALAAAVAQCASSWILRALPSLWRQIISISADRRLRITKSLEKFLPQYQWEAARWSRW